VTRQLTGAFAARLLVPMAETLARLGSEAAWLVHGGDGTDELSIAGPSQVAELRHGAVTTREVHPEEAGLAVHPFEAIVGGSPADNARALRALLGGAPGPTATRSSSTPPRRWSWQSTRARCATAWSARARASTRARPGVGWSGSPPSRRRLR
jgi:hypothetical protein